MNAEESVDGNEVKSAVVRWILGQKLMKVSILVGEEVAR